MTKAPFLNGCDTGGMLISTLDLIGNYNHFVEIFNQAIENQAIKNKSSALRHACSCPRGPSASCGSCRTPASHPQSVGLIREQPFKRFVMVTFGNPATDTPPDRTPKSYDIFNALQHLLLIIGEFLGHICKSRDPEGHMRQLKG